MEKELDNIDKSIIRILQENARTPVKDIAKEVFLSSPHCFYSVCVNCSLFEISVR